MTSSAARRLQYYLKGYLPSAVYGFLAQEYRARHFARQTSSWRSEQITIALQTGEPHLPSQEIEFFYAALKGCTTYLEYGSGGSTLTALRVVPNVISVENDRAFFRAVTHKGKSLAKGLYLPVFVHTGRTGDWGLPAVRRPTALRLWRWRRYAIKPWALIKRHKLLPDFVLVDGRFRVACALECLLRLPKNSHCRIMLDDFEQYDGAYLPVLEFAEGVERHGRAVIFRRPANLDEAHCREVLAYHYADCR